VYYLCGTQIKNTTMANKVTITKEIAEFIKANVSEEVNTGKNHERTFYLPRWRALSQVMIDCNVVTGIHDQTGNWVEYDVEFTEEAQDILDIY
jgi:hypothetical protein